MENSINKIKSHFGSKLGDLNEQISNVKKQRNDF